MDHILCLDFKAGLFLDFMGGSAIDAINHAAWKIEKALGISALLAGVNPKNLGLTLAAALTIGQAGLGGGQSADVIIDTSVATPDEAVREVLLHLEREGYISAADSE